MVTVELRNRHNKAVATIQVPDSPTRPTIVKWGATYYRARTGGEWLQDRVYDEAWCYAVPVGETVST